MKARIFILFCLLVFPGCLYSRVSKLEDTGKTTKTDLKALIQELEGLRMRVLELEENSARQAGLIERQDKDIDFLWKSLGRGPRGKMEEGNQAYRRHFKRVKKWLNAMPEEKKLSEKNSEQIAKLIANFTLELEKEKKKIAVRLIKELEEKNEDFTFLALKKRKAELYKAICIKEYKQLKPKLEALLDKENSNVLDAMLKERIQELE